MDHLLNIALVMLAAGAVGGLVNCFLSDQVPDPTEARPLAWWKYVLVGIAASFMVPLFLNMISGDLLDKIRGIDGKPADYSKMFVLAGFCLVAAVSSRAFIQSLSDRVMQQVKSANRKADEAKEQAADAKADVALVVEADSPETLSSFRVSPELAMQSSTPDNEILVLKSMIGSSYSLRSITGIAKDSGLSKELVNTTLSSLIHKELVAQAVSSTGQPRWYPTEKGRALASAG